MLSVSLALMLVPIAITNPDISTYEPMADVNRDGIVDANDLSRLGQAYGSTGLVYQENKAVITVYNETSPIENARIAIFGDISAQIPDQIGYTNLSGTASFTLNPNTFYVAVVWSGSNYNYANFTTNSLGEASLSMPLEKSTKHLPPLWVVISIVNKTSGALVSGNEFHSVGWKITECEWQGKFIGDLSTEAYLGTGYNGITIGLTSLGLTEPNSLWGFQCGTDVTAYGFSVSALDQNGTANVVIYID